MFVVVLPRGYRKVLHFHFDNLLWGVSMCDEPLFQSDGRLAGVAIGPKPDMVIGSES